MTRTARWTLGLGVLGAFVWSAWATEVSASRVVEGLPFMLDFIRRMFARMLPLRSSSMTTVIGWMSLANRVRICRLPLSSIEKSSLDKSGTRRPSAFVTVAYTATVLAKLYSEAIEAIDPGPVEAVKAAGATPLQVLRWGVLPQLVPQFLSFALYRFETNIRAAAVLGFVGAGGIGFYIQTYLRMLNYPAASAVLLVLVGLVMLVDFTSSKLRARLI